jgi:CheY-like chemotaxis protein
LPEPRVLAVEDNAEDAIFLRRAFSKGGAAGFDRVIGCGQMAIDYLSGQGEFADRAAFALPTHLLLDLKLPKVSGLELLQWLRSVPRLAELPVIVLSSSGEIGDRERAEALGVDGYFVKPSRSADLIDLVRRIAKLWNLPIRPG